MKKRSRNIIILVIVTASFATTLFRMPYLLYVPLILVSKALGGHCDESPILMRIKEVDCKQNNDSAITTENMNNPVGSPPEYPLIHAVSFNNATVFKELISKGAKPALCEGFPDNFFEKMTNCKYDSKKSTQIFAEFERLGIRHTNANRLLISQAKENCVAGIELALSQGANANATDSKGLAALHYTTRVADIESITATAALVRLGADPMRSTTTTDSPYLLAKEHLHNVGNWKLLDSAMTTVANK